MKVMGKLIVPHFEIIIRDVNILPNSKNIKEANLKRIDV